MIKELIITYLPGLSLVDFEDVVYAVREEVRRRDDIRFQSMPTPQIDRTVSQTQNITRYRDIHNCSISLAYMVIRKHW